MTRNDVFYALGIIFVVAIVGIFLNNRQDNLGGKAIYISQPGLPSETVTCSFDSGFNTCYVHFDGRIHECAASGSEKKCSITISGLSGKKALVTSSCGEEFTATLDGQDEIFMFSC
jgi:hypothetical protein